jgi:anti-sigma28 factor (negative regulator of flagellin synthesis)
MVTRITDAGTLPATTSRTDRPGAAGIRADQEAGSDAATGSASAASASAAPAVRIQLSPASQLGAGSPVNSDEALVQQIRQRLDAGQFHIDYEKVGEGMLRDLIAQSLHRTQR